LLCRSPHPDSSTVRSNQEPAQEFPARKIGLLARPFGLGWRERNKVSFFLYSLYMNHIYFKSVALYSTILVSRKHHFVQYSKEFTVLLLLCFICFKITKQIFECNRGNQLTLRSQLMANLPMRDRVPARNRKMLMV
jgi:hypothetical protein